MIAGRLLVAYHGCDVTTRDDLVSGRLPHLTESANKYDWLGPGSYFFEGDHERALQFARASHAKPKERYTAQPIATPAVVGAVLDIHQWLDMTTQDGIKEFCLAYEQMKTGKTVLPKNSAATVDDADIIHRALDNAVFISIHDTRSMRPVDFPPYQAVRGAFHQGRVLSETSNFHVGTHIQIALRASDCVKGWFLPRGQQVLSDAEYATAKESLQARIDAPKPKVRAKSAS